MNLYGLSKHLFDLAVVDRVQKREKMPPQWAGLKFFNVFGPNEYHKGAMASVLCKVFDEAKSGKPVRLFKSHREGIADGDQRRDFIYVDDTVAVMRWLLATPSVSGIFNVGTGKARSFKDMIVAMFAAMGRKPNIDYVDMPEADPRPVSVFHRKRRQQSAPRRIQFRLHAARRSGRKICVRLSRPARPLPVKRAHVRS